MGILIGVFGFAQSGKDTSVIFLQDILKTSFNINATNEKFAGALKQSAGLILNVDPIKFEDNDFKSQQIGSDWGTMTYREFLQKLGTEAAHALNPNIWVLSVFNKLTNFSNTLISDLRFPQEADAIKARKGITININRPGVGPLNNHYSENALNDYAFDYTVDNSKDLIYLKAQLKYILQDILLDNY